MSMYAFMCVRVYVYACTYVWCTLLVCDLHLCFCLNVCGVLEAVYVVCVEVFSLMSICNTSCAVLISLFSSKLNCMYNLEQPSQRAFLKWLTFDLWQHRPLLLVA